MNSVRNKFDSYEEGLAAYLKWKESLLERNEKPATQGDKDFWTAQFKELWDMENLDQVWD